MCPDSFAASQHSQRGFESTVAAPSTAWRTMSRRLLPTFWSSSHAQSPSHRDSSSEANGEAHQTTAGPPEGNGASASSRSKHPPTEFIPPESASHPQPVLVRTHTSKTPYPSSLSPAAPTMSHPAPSLPPTEAFTFSSVLRAIEPDVQDSLQAIVEICAKSRMSLADQHGAHIPPQGEIGGRSGLAAVPEASSSNERLAEGNGQGEGKGRGKRGEEERWMKLVSGAKTAGGLVYISPEAPSSDELISSSARTENLRALSGMGAPVWSRWRGTSDSSGAAGTIGDGDSARTRLRNILQTATVQPAIRAERPC